MEPSTESRARLDGLWIGLFFLAVYEVLRQRMLYGDGPTLLVLISLESFTHSVHLLYVPLVWFLRGLTGSSGITVFELTSHLSCLATAVGVVLAHWSFRVLRLPRGGAGLATILMGFAPGIVFYATVVEVQATLFAASTVSFVAAAALVVRPDRVRAMLLGLATAGAYFAHATAALLPLPLLLMFWATVLQNRGSREGITPGTCAVLTLIVAVSHAAAIWGVSFVLRTIDLGIVANPGNATNFLAIIGNLSKPPTWALEVLWNEWLLAFLPISVISLGALCVRETRWMALALAISVVVYLGVSFVLLVYSERGAYLLPLAWPAAWIVSRFPRPIVLASAILGAATAVTMVKLHDQPERGIPFARGFQEVTADAPSALLLGGAFDLEARYLHLPDVPFLPLGMMSERREMEEAILPVIDGLVSSWLEQGRRVFLTSRAEEMGRRDGFLGAEVLEQVVLPHIRSRYELVAVESGGFKAKELRRK